METLLGLVLVVAVVIVVLRVAGRRARRTRFKCHDCRHLRRTFDDVYVATLSSLIAASLTVALLRARDRHEAHP